MELKTPGFRTLMKQITQWRDAAIHHLSPLVLVTGPPGNPDTIPQKDKTLIMVNEPDVDYGGLRDHLSKDIWISPLEIPKRWRDSIMKLCQEICNDIGQSFTRKISAAANPQSTA